MGSPLYSGYDFGYLLKILTCSALPAEEGDFFDLLRTYFPCIYDIKYLMKSCKNLKGGLQELANDLDVSGCCMMHDNSNSCVHDLSPGSNVCRSNRLPELELNIKQEVIVS